VLFFFFFFFFFSKLLGTKNLQNTKIRPFFFNDIPPPQHLDLADRTDKEERQKATQSQTSQATA
jgi:hypothetical protein